ncbi:MAG: lmo0937 family membrane protein, partial [Gemmatimonadales bacterium]|nr:lmo0937 family membrane protein [Gemmatimonadales bacterium]
MLLTLAAVLFVLWILGFFAFHVAGGLIHVLIVL